VKPSPNESSCFNRDQGATLRLLSVACVKFTQLVEPTSEVFGGGVYLDYCNFILRVYRICIGNGRLPCSA